MAQKEVSLYVRDILPSIVFMDPVLITATAKIDVPVSYLFNLHIGPGGYIASNIADNIGGGGHKWLVKTFKDTV